MLDLHLRNEGVKELVAVKLRKVLHLSQVVYVEKYRRQLGLLKCSIEYIDFNRLAIWCKNSGEEGNDSLIADKDCADVDRRCGVSLHYWELRIAHVWVYYQ